MAARTLRPRHQEDVRLKIQTTQLIKRLENYALNDGEEEITHGRLKAIEILLRKSLPDLSSTTFEGNLTVNPLSELLHEVNGSQLKPNE